MALSNFSQSLPTLRRGITSNHNGDFLRLNCFHSQSTINRLKKHERVCNDHDYFHVKMPNNNKKILIYNHGKKLLKASFFVSFDTESLLPKMRSCQNNPDKSYIERKSKGIPLGCALSLTCPFDATKSNRNYYRGEDCIERACKGFKNYAMKII